MIVDFGEDHYSQGCEAEGVLCHDMMSGSGTGGSGCTSVGTVTVSDGRFTATGYSHDTGLCHSISMVQLRTAIQLGDPNVDYQFFFGSTMPALARDDAILDDGTGFATNREQGLSYVSAAAPFASSFEGAQKCTGLELGWRPQRRLFR